MFLMRLLEFLLGWVEWEAEGGFPERFLNLASRHRIPLTRTHRQGISLLGCCYARHYRRLRPLARRSGVRLRLTARHGLPFSSRRYRGRWGLAVGLAVYILMLQIFPHYIWSVDVTGNSEVPASRIESVMAGLGVRVGAGRTDFDLRTIQLKAIEELPELSWLAVNLEGSIAHIEVNERVTAEQPPDLSQPANLKASRDGRVVSTRIVDGQAVVQKGDAVVKGMLLASGVVDTAGGPLLKHARGEVLAETTHTFTTTIPLTETLNLPQKEGILRPTLQLFSLEIPLYTSGQLPDTYQEKVYVHPLTARGIRLPIGFTNRYYYPLTATVIHRTPQQAEELARQELEAWKTENLSGATIQSQEETRQQDNSAYSLSVTFSCVENIAVEEPIHIRS